jgi:hypothetical protein
MYIYIYINIGVLTLIEDLIFTCPASIYLVIYKCNALNKLNRWDESKLCAEEFMSHIHETIQKKNSHRHAIFPAPNINTLKWVEKTAKNVVSVDVDSIVHILLCMGSYLAQVYVNSLKNVESCRNCSGDVMLKMTVILHGFIEVDDIQDNYDWVHIDLKRVRELVHWKDFGDKQFRGIFIRICLYTFIVLTFVYIQCITYMQHIFVYIYIYRCIYTHFQILIPLSRW